LNHRRLLVVAYMATNGAAIEKAVNSIVARAYRPVASLASGSICYLIVNGAAKSDAKKLANG
jgi:hypothetical protein